MNDKTEVTPEQADAMIAEAQTELNVNSEMEQAVQETKENDFQDAVVEEIIQFQLDKNEKSESAESLVQLFDEKKKVEKEAKDVAKDYKERVSDYQARVDSVLDKIENGEERMVQCVKRVYFSKGIVEFRSVEEDVDGNAVVYKTRKMDPEDRQLSLSEPVAESNFASETDAIDAGSLGVSPETDPYDDSDKPLETVTEKMLTENAPTTF